MAANNWNNGAADGKWSTDGNWSLGHKPTATETATFATAVSAANCAIDAAAECLGLVMATYAGTITQGAFSLAIGSGGFSIDSGVFTASAIGTVSCAGSFTWTAGTVTDDVIMLTMTGDSTTLTTPAWWSIRTLTISGNVTLTHPAATYPAAMYFSVTAGKTLTIANGKSLEIYKADAWTYSNLGAIAGTGTLRLTFRGSSVAVTFGAVSCPVIVYCHDAAAASRTLTMGASAVLGSTLSLLSGHAANTMTLDLASYSLTCTTLTVGVRGILTTSVTGAGVTGNVVLSDATSVMSQTAGCSITITGNYTQTNGAVTTAGILTVTGAFTLTAGTFVQGAYDISTGSVTMDGGTLTGNANAWWTCSGTAWTYAAGTFTNNVMRVKLTGSTCTFLSGGTIHSLWAISTSVVTWNQVASIRNSLNNEGTLVVNGANTISWNGWVGGTFVNTGRIYGSGTVAVQGLASTLSFDGGSISCAIRFQAHASSTGNSIVNIVANQNYGSTVLVDSSHAAWTITVNLAGHSLSATTITAGTRGIISSTVAGAVVRTGTAISVGANGTLLGANTTFNIGGNWASHDGTWTPGDSTVIMRGQGTTISISAAQTFYNLVIAGNSGAKLAAAATVTNEMVQASELYLNGYALTFSGGGDKWYDRRRLHILKKIGPAPISKGYGDCILDYLGDVGSMN